MRVAGGDRGELYDLLGCGEAEANFAGLPGAEDFARAAQAQILFGDAEAVVGLTHQSEACPARFRQLLAADKQAGALALTAPNASAKLVELCEAEAFGAFDDHEGRVGDIDADLDDGRGDEYSQLARRE